MRLLSSAREHLRPAGLINVAKGRLSLGKAALRRPRPLKGVPCYRFPKIIRQERHPG